MDLPALWAAGGLAGGLAAGSLAHRLPGFFHVWRSICLILPYLKDLMLNIIDKL